MDQRRCRDMGNGRRREKEMSRKRGRNRRASGRLGSIRMKVRRLQRMVPGGRGLLPDLLFLRTVDYILHLRAPVINKEGIFSTIDLRSLLPGIRVSETLSILKAIERKLYRFDLELIHYL
ncbi:hypothetical protein NE237_020101 [Protea cynaroides]|uniref:Uncharacterized protein n=1 Tax=Protea cynaroides TaxID=273540 RepID=A0A9Q0H7S3_9MAGN|nr:hypothetical protein NE237_020101 [Protea cynaroides]